MLLTTMVLLGSAFLPQQFGGDQNVFYEVTIAPAAGEIPRGGIFLATVDYSDQERINRMFVQPLDDEFERAGEAYDVEIFRSCTRWTPSCIYRGRFPADEPRADRIQFIAQRDPYFGEATLDVGAPDTSPPFGIDSTTITVTEAEPTPRRPNWTYGVEVSAPDLDDDRGVILLELFDTTEGDQELIGHVIKSLNFGEENLTQIAAPIDVPESTSRCYKLVATDRGGNTTTSDDICFDIILDQDPAPACDHRQATHDSDPRLGWMGLMLLAFSLRRTPRRR